MRSKERKVQIVDFFLIVLAVVLVCLTVYNKTKKTHKSMYRYSNSFEKWHNSCLILFTGYGCLTCKKYISVIVAVGKLEIQLSEGKGWDPINQCHPATFCVRPKPGPAFLIAYVTVYFVLNGLRWEVVVRFVDIGGIQTFYKHSFHNSSKYNKGNAKRGVSPRLKNWPSDLDLWPMTLKINKVPDSLKD
jgi:hypothetical protein